MGLSIGTRLKHAWNAFTNRDPTNYYKTVGPGYSLRPDRPRLSRGNERSIVNAIFNRIALDVASIDIKHCKLDDNGRYIEDVKSGLNDCLNVEANVDQTGRAFRHDIVMSMFDEGCVAIVPVDTTLDPKISSSYDIQSMRTGKVIEWYPSHVKVRLYNDRKGEKEDIVLPKRQVSIVENPFYSVVNEPNSTMQRLIRKLSLLDVIDEQTASGKLDLIIQLPYVVKTEARREQADKRRKDIETQLSEGKYGIAYTDGTEKITQLNRPVENNLMKHIEYLTNMVYSQLGMTQSIMDGTADEKTMLNYTNRTIEPIISAIVDEMKRKFITKTARTQGQSICYFTNPFKLVPVNDIAEIADKFTRNEILTSNEIRQIIGMKPSNDPKADRLVNSNISQPNETTDETINNPFYTTEQQYNQDIADLDNIDRQLDKAQQIVDQNSEIKHYASPYYDPQKAHEYYMKNRELKGRTSTAKLNDEGKAAAKYVKEQLTSERKTKSKGLQEQKKKSIKSKKEEMQKKIDDLMTKLENMSVKNDDDMERFSNMIDSLREQNKQTRLQLQEDYKSQNTKLREEYDQKYADELEKIRSDSKFTK